MAIEKSEEKLSSILLLQLACLIVAAISFRLFVPAYSSLPRTYPILITLSGAPVGLVTKSWFSVLLPPLIQSGFFLLMAGLAFWVAFSPRSLADLIPIDVTEPRMLPAEMKNLRLRAAFFGSLISLLTLLCATNPVRTGLLHRNCAGVLRSFGSRLGGICAPYQVTSISLAYFSPGGLYWW